MGFLNQKEKVTEARYHVKIAAKTLKNLGGPLKTELRAASRILNRLAEEFDTDLLYFKKKIGNGKTKIIKTKKEKVS